VNDNKNESISVLRNHHWT